jgi:hypothetical protein
MKALPFGLALLSVLLIAGSVAEASYSLSVSTDKQTYAGAASIHLAGQVSPAPGPNTAVLIRIFNPNKVIVTADEAPVNGTTGLYTKSIVAGGSANWISGNYLVNASWGAFGPTIFQTTTFSWSATGSTTTTSTSSTTSTTTSTSTSSSTTSTSSSVTPTTTATSTQPSITTTPTSSSTSSGGGGGIPEFPFQYVTVAAFTILVVASYLVIGRGRKLGTNIR